MVSLTCKLLISLLVETVYLWRELSLIFYGLASAATYSSMLSSPSSLDLRLKPRIGSIARVIAGVVENSSSSFSGGALSKGGLVGA